MTRCSLLLVTLGAVLLLGAALVPKGAVVRMPFDTVPDFSSTAGRLSANGRWLAFQSMASNITSEASDFELDIYLVDLKQGDVLRASRTAADGDPALDCSTPAIDPSGRYVAYSSIDDAIVPGDNVGSTDVFLFDRKKETTQLVSVLPAGGPPPSGVSFNPSVSTKGRWVAFSSNSGSLVPGDVNGMHDVFLRDMKQGATTMLSVTPEGGMPGADSSAPAINANGRYVAFRCSADLLPEDDNGESDVYRYDRKQDLLELVSVSDAGEVGDSDSGAGVDISANGRYVCFSSAAQNLVPVDLGGAINIVFVFRRDMKKGTIQLVNTTADGTPVVGVFTSPAISPDGRYVAFRTGSEELGPDDDNGDQDLYLKDTEKGAVERLTLGFGGVDTNNDSSRPSLSKKAKFAAFDSSATNFLDGPDGNTFTDVFVKRR